jgi:hypothetical protein
MVLHPAVNFQHNNHNLPRQSVNCGAQDEKEPIHAPASTCNQPSGSTNWPPRCILQSEQRQSSNVAHLTLTMHIHSANRAGGLRQIAMTRASLLMSCYVHAHGKLPQLPYDV